MVREGVDTREVMRRTMPVVEKLGRDQRRELIEMLSAVAATDGRNDEMTTFDIQSLQQTARRIERDQTGRLTPR